MRAVILDTNIIVGASGLLTHMSDRCRLNCTRRVLQWRKNAIHLVVDTENLILEEYIKQFRSLQRKSDFPGSAAELLLRQLVTLRGRDDDHATEYAIKRVILTSLGEHEFEEYPKDDMKLERFDRSDRKWIAAALSCRQLHGVTPEIQNAADSDWDSVAEHLLEAYGISVSNICG